MIRVDAIELLHWDMQPHQRILLAGGVTLLTGENGSGKTSVLDAIKVALGVTRLDAHRTIDGYLGKQAAPIAMVRLVLDNRPRQGTRRRPLDAIHPGWGDVATLAVVFRSDGENSWEQRYYLLDGDVVPIGEGSGTRRGAHDPHKPLPGLSAYRQQLRRMGVGDQYRKLLELGQGRIARLCELSGAGLFDTLFDVIGGRDTLEEWETRRRELNEQRHRKQQVEQDLAAHRKDLGLLAERAQRHGRWRQVQATLETLERALPHARLLAGQRAVDAAQEVIARVEGERDRQAHTLDAVAARLGVIEAQMREAGALRSELLEARTQLATRLDAARAEHHEVIRRQAVLEDLRRRAEHASSADLEALERALEACGESVSDGMLRQRERTSRRAQIDAEFATLAQGLVPWPAEVEAFREALRCAGLPHHLLAEVVEVTDPEWTAALEGFLGPLRFAVVVHDPEGFDVATDLARRLRYPHGVLAPDVRGRSPDDDEGLVPLVEVKEPRFKPLLARLLRRLVPADPSRPYAPPRDGDVLAHDGFLLSRLVARHTSVERFWLGREALAQRRAVLEAERRGIADMDAAWQAEHSGLRARKTALESAIGLERTRREWEAARDDHAAIEERATALQGEIRTLEVRDRLLEADAAKASERVTAAAKDRESAERERGKATSEHAAAVASLPGLRDALRQDEEALGRLQAAGLPERDAAIDDVLAESSTAEVLAARIDEKRKAAMVFTESDRDPLVPLHHERQQAELQAVERQLSQVHADLDRTAAAAEEAHQQYQTTTRRVFRAYFERLGEAGKAMEFQIEGHLESREDSKFTVDLRVAVGDKAAVHHDSEDLSGGQKAALSMLMAMTAVAHDDEGPGFFLVDEPFAASDVQKINDLGRFLQRTGARYVLSMPTSADLAHCGDWLEAVWACTKTRGGFDARGRPVLAPPLKQMFARGARDD